jgi:hypothetical protein
MAPKPGVVPLRPLAVGEILDGAFAAIRAYPKLMLGVSAVVVGVSQVLNVLVARVLLRDTARLTLQRAGTAADPAAVLRAIGPALANSGVAFLITSLAQLVLSGFLTVVVGQAVLGRSVSVAEAWARLRPRLLPLFALTILYGLIVLGGTLLLVIPGIWLFVLYALAAPALVLESAPIGRAFGRSRALVRGSWWRVCGILLLATLLGAIVAGVIQLPFSLFSGISAFLAHGAGPSLGSLVASAVGETIAGTVVYPFAASVHVLLYLDQRMRREGFDIELARAAGAPAPAPASPAGPPPSW